MKHTNVNQSVLVQTLAPYLAKNTGKQVLAGSKTSYITSIYVAVGQRKFTAAIICNLLATKMAMYSYKIIQNTLSIPYYIKNYRFTLNSYYTQHCLSTRLIIPSLMSLSELYYGEISGVAVVFQLLAATISAALFFLSNVNVDESELGTISDSDQRKSVKEEREDADSGVVEDDEENFSEISNGESSAVMDYLQNWASAITNTEYWDSIHRNIIEMNYQPIHMSTLIAAGAAVYIFLLQKQYTVSVRNANGSSNLRVYVDNTLVAKAKDMFIQRQYV
jgi:hypothetical protein